MLFINMYMERVRVPNRIDKTIINFQILISKRYACKKASIYRILRVPNTKCVGVRFFVIVPRSV